MPEMSPLATLAIAACRLATAAANGCGGGVVMKGPRVAGRLPGPTKHVVNWRFERNSPLQRQLGQLCCPLPARFTAWPRAAGNRLADACVWWLLAIWGDRPQGTTPPDAAVQPFIRSGRL